MLTGGNYHSGHIFVFIRIISYMDSPRSSDYIIWHPFATVGGRKSKIGQSFAVHTQNTYASDARRSAYNMECNNDIVYILVTVDALIGLNDKNKHNNNNKKNYATTNKNGKKYVIGSRRWREYLLQNLDLPEISDESVVNVQRRREGTVRIGRCDRTAFNPAPDHYAAGV